MLARAWPFIVAECRRVLGSELHYQAVVYYCLRLHGEVPLEQLGMNVKMWIDNPVSELFRQLDLKKHEHYRGGFEPIPDVCLFSTRVEGDWRRRKRKETLETLLLAIEIKASERANSRLGPGEIIRDIMKVAAHREEAEARGSSFSPVVMVIDTAPEHSEQMTFYGLRESEARAREVPVGFLYVSPSDEINTLPLA
ncbi:MAG: hypothetical protein AVDCRST_MAG25-1324 [uncultured Rubrobacteraceae bacterium]|uniref:Uncharacterized protein n=1 Tax=uncultured Rubrobacteraceae bacterium TaxID=349277 RepID=A0A6J4R8E8_9ACTN|nr:MAG: hypothetical protein AVDCRST_MAG25-1324 [uncultured Rubrobacteraceae bacterium]